MVSDAAHEYFRLENAQTEIDESFPPKFVNIEEIPFVHLAEGVRFKPIFGKNILFNYVFFEPHALAPMHQHPEEQIGTILEGEYEFEMNGVARMMRPGDVYVVPPNVPHSARTYDSRCLAIDIFSPPRTGFREMLDRVQWEGLAGEQNNAQNGDKAADPS
jgi:quercetin dioxygenase-like cupin family protein